MKLLFDLFPVLLFFIAFKLGHSFPDATQQLAASALGPLIADGVVPPDQAPILIATAVAIIATLVQVAIVLARGRRVEPMLWISLGVIVVFGGATIWLHDETFIKWKPTILYWLFATVLVGGRVGFGRNLIQSLLGTQLAVPTPIWERLLWVWVGFFMLIGALNLAVAFSVPTETWVNFKLFGLLGLTFAFTLGVGIWLARHMKEVPDA